MFQDTILIWIDGVPILSGEYLVMMWDEVRQKHRFRHLYYSTHFGWMLQGTIIIDIGYKVLAHATIPPIYKLIKS